MIARKVPDLVSALAIGASLVLAGLVMWIMAILGAFGIVGAAVAFCALPLVLLAPTPRSWWFLSCAAAALAACTAISYAIQLLHSNAVEVEGRTWSQDTGWTPITRPEPVETILTATVIGVALLIATFGALGLLKRVGVAAKPSGPDVGL